MLKDSHCFTSCLHQGFDYIIHTACPLIQESEGMQYQNDVFNSYISSTNNLIKKVLEIDKTKKFVYTGSLTSVIGCSPN
jgi:nucleoside-diphosphate-sugar epimerase